MKKCIILFISVFQLISTSGFAETSPQTKRLMAAYKNEFYKPNIDIPKGANLFSTLYWHPATCDAFKKHVPSIERWGVFDNRVYESIPEAERTALLENLGTKLDQMDPAQQEDWWEDISLWWSTYTQITMLMTISEMGFEDFTTLLLKLDDPTLSPGFQWIIEHKSPKWGKDASGLSTANSENVYPMLTNHLINIPEKERFECYSRILAKVAEEK